MDLSVYLDEEAAAEGDNNSGKVKIEGDSQDKTSGNEEKENGDEEGDDEEDDDEEKEDDEEEEKEDDDEEEEEDEGEPTEETLAWRAEVQGIQSPNVVKKQDLFGFPQGDFALLRLHRFVKCTMGRWDSNLRIEFTYEDDCPGTSFEIHYIELQHYQLGKTAGSDAFTIYGEGRPDQIVSVGSDFISKCPVAIHAYDTSDQGDYAATLYVAEGFVHVDLWDIRSPKNNDDVLHEQQQATKAPQIINKPFASAKIKVSKKFTKQGAVRRFSTWINISSSGSQVAMSITLDDDGNDGHPFSVCKVPLAAPADGDLSQPWKLEQTMTICDGKKFRTASFHRPNPNNDNEDGERFWGTDGLTFSVYSTKGTWDLLYALNMQNTIDDRTIQTIDRSIHGRYFAWTGSRGAISIWDFETGNLVSHHYTGDDEGVAHPSLSLDGSKIALTVGKKIEIRDTMTGIKLGVLKKGLNVRKKGLGDEDYFEVLFGKDYFLIYNVEAATVSKPMRHNIRSVVRVRDMAIVKTFYMHEDYDLEYPQSSHAPTFGYRHGPILNILKPGPILDHVNTKDACTGFDICEKITVERSMLWADFEDKLTSAAGSKFFLKAYTEFILSEHTLVLRVSMVNQMDDDSETDLRRFDVPIGPTSDSYYTYFIPETSQLGVTRKGSLSLWTLSAKPGVPFCRLTSIWKFQEARKVISVESCRHGKNLKIVLSLEKGGDDTLTVPISPGDMLSISPKDTHPNKEEYRLNQGFVELIDIYAKGNERCKQAIVRYLKARIRQSRERSSVSPLHSICEAWTQDRGPFIESLISQLLPADRIT
ncbi:hypothetical protein EDD21DRAFT_433564 [Dissophora ornata]|nr:hypothetical protein EDD21DRAFT_433564 [Dissophora ornata]